MIHPHTELRLISPEIGLGPVVTRFIPKGTIVWVLDRFDIVMSPQQVEELPRPYRAIAERYAYVDPSGSSILCWDHARFMNHHCEPAVRGVTPQFQITVRDVHPGEELTCEYAECNIVNLDCRCGSPRCRGRIRAEDLIEHAAAWQAEVQAALGDARTVPQPLWQFLEDPDAARRILDGSTEATPMPSFLCTGTLALRESA